MRTKRPLINHVSAEKLTTHRVCNQSNTTGATSGAGNEYTSVAPEFNSGFWWGSSLSIFSFMCSVL